MVPRGGEGKEQGRTSKYGKSWELDQDCSCELVLLFSMAMEFVDWLASLSLL